MTPEERARVDALTPDDRAWLAEQGWRDPSKDYPVIGTEQVLE